MRLIPISLFAGSALLVSQLSLVAAEIVSVDLYEYRIPRTTAFATAKGSSTSTPGIFLRVEARQGDRSLISWGDILPRLNVTNESMDDAWAAALEFSKHLIGLKLTGATAAEDLAIVEQILQDLSALAAARTLTVSNPPRADRQLRATQAGFDMALLGMAGEKHGIPLFEVFGPAAQTGVSISGLTASIGISPDEGRERVTGARTDYRMARLKIGLEPEEDLKLLQAIASAIVEHRPGFEIFVDVNQAWGDAANSIAQLARIREMLAATGFRGRFICEQPTHEDSFEDLAAVTAVTRAWAQVDEFQILIMADEILWDRTDLEKLIELDAVDQVNFKIQKAGGIAEIVRMGRLLYEKKPHWEVYVGGLLMTDVGATANLHLGHALPRLDYMTGALARRSDVVNPATRPLLYQSGTRTLVVPSAPGLGTGVDLEALQPFIGRNSSVREEILSTAVFNL